MLFELRQYRALPGRRDELVALMETRVIPFQISLGVSVVASFVGEEDPDLYVWIRRFASEEQRAELYEKIYQSEEWLNELSSSIPSLMDRERNQVTRLLPTPVSPLH